MRHVRDMSVSRPGIGRFMHVRESIRAEERSIPYRNPTLKLAIATSVHLGSSDVPRYYFDVSDGVRRYSDESGIALESCEDASEEAEVLLRLLAYEQLDIPKTKVLKAVVRDDDGRHIYRGTIITGRGAMLFSGRRL